MAEIDAGEHWQADRENLFRKDTDTGPLKKAYRRVFDQTVADLLTEIRDGLEITAGETYHASTTGSTTPGIIQTLHSHTVPGGKTRELSQVVVSCRIEGDGWIYVDGALAGSFRTGAAQPSASFRWIPRYPVATGLEIKVDFRARSGSPITNVDCHIQAVDKPI